MEIFFLFFSSPHGGVYKQLSGTSNCPGFFPLCQHNSMERVSGEKIWLANRKQISQMQFLSFPFFLSFSLFFLFLLNPLSFSHIFLCSLFHFSLMHSLFPRLLPISFIPSHTHPSAICAVKWDFRLHNVAWGFSFHIILQADPMFFFSFSASHSLQPSERKQSERKSEKAAALFQILKWKMITRPNVSAQTQGK